MRTRRSPGREVSEFIRACHRVADIGLLECSSGNMSERIGGGLMLATTSRSWLGRITPAQVTVCRIADGKATDGKRPTVEVAFHAGILRTRPDVNVVLHHQSPFATVLSCRAKPKKLNYFVLPEIPFYMGEIAEIPFLPPGSPQLMEAVVAAMREHDMLIMGNHGQVTVAEDFNHAIQNAAFMELACMAIVLNGYKTSVIRGKAARALVSG